MPILDDGFVPTTAKEYETVFSDSFESDVGFEVDWDRDRILGNIRVIISFMCGDLSESAAFIQTIFDPASATGINLDNLCSAVGVYRNDETFSTVSIDIVGASGAVLSPGDLTIEGGGNDGSAKWVLSDTVTISGGVASAVFTATDPGPVSATAGQITTIVNPTTSVTSVNNPSPATPGEYEETDEDLRIRRLLSVGPRGASPLRSLRRALLDLDYIVTVAAIDNPSSLFVTVEGIAMNPHSIAAVVMPSTLTDDQKKEVAETIYNHVGGGIETIGSVVVTTVEGGDGFNKTIAFDYASDLPVLVVVTATPETNYTVSDLSGDIASLIEDGFSNLLAGEDLTDFDVTGLIRDVTGLKRATVTLNGTLSVTALLSQRIVLNGSVSVI